MEKTPLTHFYTATSQFAYLGHRELIRLVRASRKSVIHKPFRLMKCLQSIGYHPLEERTSALLSISLARAQIAGQNIGQSLCQQNFRQLTMIGQNSLT